MNHTVSVAFAILANVIVVFLSSTSVQAQGKPTGEPDRLNNGIPDYHQYEAQIVEVIDADSIRVDLYILPGLVYDVSVRAKGVDSPELRRPSCEWEKQLAIEAKEAVERSFEVGEWVYIEDLEPGSFSGRIVGEIKQWYGNQRWRTLSDFLMRKEGRWAVEYKRGKPFDWCRNIE